MAAMAAPSACIYILGSQERPRRRSDALAVGATHKRLCNETFGGRERLPDNLPDGRPLRVLEEREIYPMSWVIERDYIFPDATILSGISIYGHFSPDGRHMICSTYRDNLQIFDFKERIFYLYKDMPELSIVHKVTDTEVMGSSGRSSDPFIYCCPINELKKNAAPQDFVQVSDIWLIRSEWERYEELANPRVNLAPSNAPKLSFRPLIPTSLKDLEDPLLPLRQPSVEIVVNDEPSGLRVSASPLKLDWLQSGQGFICKASPIDEVNNSHWLWMTGEGWRIISSDSKN
jgi:hypothetical protein